MPSGSYTRSMPYPPKIDTAALGRTALQVVERHGWESWTLRDVAASLDVSVNALYRHVDSRDHLATQAGAAAAVDLRAAIADVDESLGPVERVVAMSRRYIGFASTRPHAYTAFIRGKPGPAAPQTAAWNDLWADVLDQVAAAVPAAGGAAAFALWSMLHGRAELCRGTPVDPHDGLDDAVRAMIAGFQQSGLLASPVPTAPA